MLKLLTLDYPVDSLTVNNLDIFPDSLSTDFLQRNFSRDFSSFFEVYFVEAFVDLLTCF